MQNLTEIDFFNGNNSTLEPIADEINEISYLKNSIAFSVIKFQGL